MFSVRARQIAGVTSLVGLIVLTLTLMQLSAVSRITLEETGSRAELVANSIYQSAFSALMDPDGALVSADPAAVLRGDSGIRAILDSAIGYSDNVIYAAVVDDANRAVVHSDPEREGATMSPGEPFATLVTKGPIARMKAIYSDDAGLYEIRQALIVGDQQWSVRVGVSTLLIADQFWNTLKQATTTALVALGLALVASLLLSQWILRPIHVISSGLTRLGKGESGVTLDLPPGEEFRELGTSFDALSAQLAQRDQAAAQPATAYETMVASLEDAVALFDQSGTVMFANPAMDAVLPALKSGVAVDQALEPEHPARKVVEESLHSKRPHGPVVARLAGNGREERERQLATHTVPGQDGELAGVMLVARNLDYLSQVHSTISYSRKLAALGRLFAGVTHEVKNPLNAMTIHLELLRGKLAKIQAEPDVVKHADVIGAEIKRLDEVVVNFLKFTRPEELQLEPVDLERMVSHVARTVEPEATKNGVAVKVDVSESLPPVNGDASMLGQVFMNLAVNAIQAMPEGGTLRLEARAIGRRVRVDVIDTGQGISPENLARIFDLYFTTKKKGSGIGLSMVYRIIQLHDGEVEVSSTPGAGTQFRIFLPQA